MSGDSSVLNNVGAIARKLEAKSSFYKSKVFLPETVSKIWPGTNTTAKARQHAKDWQGGLELLLYYAFSRGGGGEQAGYQALAVDAVRNASAEREGFGALATQSKPGEFVFEKFQDLCRVRGIGENERLNRVIVGLTKLAVGAGQSPVLWIKGEIAESRQLEHLFLKLLGIRGIGEKLASFILRDIVWLYQLERDIEKRDLLYLQPVDIWIRRVASLFWKHSHLESDKVPKLLVAKRLAEFCYSEGISGTQFNQGAWYFCAIEVKEKNLLEQRLRDLEKDP